MKILNSLFLQIFREYQMSFRDAMTDKIIDELPAGLTRTCNGALSYQPGSAHLEFFSKVMARDKASATPVARIQQVLATCWQADPRLTLRLIFQKRDSRGGAGERKVFDTCLRWLAEHHPDQVLLNMKHIPFYGRWKDVLEFMQGTSLEATAVELVAQQLHDDWLIWQQVKAIQEQVVRLSDTVGDRESEQKRREAQELLSKLTLCSKWAPTEGTSLDKRARKAGGFPLSGQIARTWCKLAGSETTGHSSTMKWYRSRLSELRTAIGVIEPLLCAQSWEKIEFSKIPSKALSIYAKKCFPKHCSERFSQWQRDVLEGKAKINTGQVDPYEIVQSLMSHGAADAAYTATAQAFFEKQISELRKRGDLGDAIVVADVSGSMTGTPMSVSIALAIWMSQLSSSAFRNLFVTFDSNPQFVDLSSCNGDLVKMVHKTMDAPWGMSTNLQAVFQLLLSRAQQYKVSEEDMPKRIIIVSDMQFNMACKDSGSTQLFTNYETVVARYRAAGYKLPELVFWNVNGTTGDQPVQHDEKGCMLMGGFSKDLIDLLLTNTPLKTPQEQMLLALANERYNRLQFKKADGTIVSTGTDEPPTVKAAPAMPTPELVSEL